MAWQWCNNFSLPVHCYHGHALKNSLLYPTTFICQFLTSSPFPAVWYELLGVFQYTSSKPILLLVLRLMGELG